jgi:hypothetical protein
MLRHLANLQARTLSVKESRSSLRSGAKLQRLWDKMLFAPKLRCSARTTLVPSAGIC